MLVAVAVVQHVSAWCAVLLGLRAAVVCSWECLHDQCMRWPMHALTQMCKAGCKLSSVQPWDSVAMTSNGTVWHAPWF